jgi:hypothetical protein
MSLRWLKQHKPWVLFNTNIYKTSLPLIPPPKPHRDGGGQKWGERRRKNEKRWGGGTRLSKKRKNSRKQRRHSEGSKKRYLLLKFDNVDETKMSNKHLQQNVTNGWYILMNETDHKDKIVWRWMNCDHFNPNENLGDIFNTKILQLRG